MDRFEQLSARYLEELLSPSECRELSTLVERESGTAARLAELYALHRQLDALHRAAVPDAIESILEHIRRGEKDFVDAVFFDVKTDRQRALRKPRTALGEMLTRLRHGATTRTGFALAASMVLFLGIGVWLFPYTNDQATLSLTPDTSANVERGTETFAVRDLTKLQPGDVLCPIGGTAPVTLSFAPEPTRVELYPGGELKLSSNPHGKRFELRAGKLIATVARQRPFRPMEIVTPQAEARVLGTQFTLSVTTNGTRLEVTQGKVQFTRTADGKAVKVAAGNYAVAAPNYELLAQPLTGSILREYWTNMPGELWINILTSSPDYPDKPSGREYLKTFEAPSDWGQDYGARICGFVHPPRSGDYTFWLSGSLGTGLRFSPDDDPRHARQVATARNDQQHMWTEEKFQQSPAIHLVAGRKYYIEALQKHGRGADHLAVAWQGPGREREIIPGEFLSPLKTGPTEDNR